MKFTLSCLNDGLETAAKWELESVEYRVSWLWDANVGHVKFWEMQTDATHSRR